MSFGSSARLVATATRLGNWRRWAVGVAVACGAASLTPPMLRRDAASCTPAQQSPQREFRVHHFQDEHGRPFTLPHTHLGESGALRKPGVVSVPDHTQQDVDAEATSAERACGQPREQAALSAAQTQQAVAQAHARIMCLHEEEKCAPLDVAVSRRKSFKDKAYIELNIHGWTVFMNTQLFTEEEGHLGKELVKCLRAHLYNIVRVVPHTKIAALRSIPIWVEKDNAAKIECCCYHVSSEWLKEHGFNTDKVKGIEITHARRYLGYSIDEPWILLHELAHGYHGRVLGWDNKQVLQCFHTAVDSKNYEEVLRNSAHRVKSYALTDEREYFAKLTETWLGVSDFFPFNHAELREHDVPGWYLMNDTWGPPPTHWYYKPPFEWESEKTANAEESVGA